MNSARHASRKKKNFFENAQRSKTWPWTWIQTHTKSIPGHSLKFSYFNLKVIIYYLLLLLLLLFFFFVRKLCQPKLIIFDSQKSKSPFVKYSNPTQLLQHCSVNASRYDIVGILNTSLYSRGGRKPYTSQSLWRTIL